MKKKILYAVLIVLVLAQFIRIDKTNPVAREDDDFLAITNAPDNIAMMLKNACYDCHSYQTAYPWYTSISPIGHWIKGHIKVGRQNLNFSEWGRIYNAAGHNDKIKESIEEIDYKTMPMKSYTWLHPKAKLSDDQRTELVNWLKSLDY